MVRDWDLAGYRDQNGTISKHIPAGHLIIPGAITQKNGTLFWHYGPSAEHAPPRHRSVHQNLLNQFVKLWKSPEDRILPFAKQNGVLWLGRDRLPCQIGVSGIEPLEDWCRISRRVCALLNIGSALYAADLLNKNTVPNDEWRWVGAYPEELLKSLQHPAASRSFLSIEVRRMLSSWGLGFSMRWNASAQRFELEIDHRGCMLNAVLLQLALTLSNSDSLFVCSGCSLPYARNRKIRRPRPGQGNFCDDCGTKASLRQADQRRKVRNEAKRRLAAISARDPLRIESET